MLCFNILWFIFRYVMSAAHAVTVKSNKYHDLQQLGDLEYFVFR